MQLPADLFHPRHYAAVRKPLLQAETLPTWCYTSDAFYQREVERIWRKAWNFVGHVDQVAKPGDYLAMEFAGVPLIIVRGKDNVVRAFANACRHRGSTLLDDGAGHCSTIVCPYHSWSYGLDGTLLGAPEMHKTEGFKPAENGLVELRFGSWGGFLFVCFDNAAPPLATWLGGLPEKLDCYALDDMVLARRKVFDMECNWKIFVENAKESYHIGTVHKATINKYASARSAGYWVEEPTGEYVITFAQHENSMALLQGDAGFPPIETLAGRREASGTYAPLLYPSTYLACTIDCAWYLELHPLGPNRTRLVHGALFPRSRMQRPDFAQLAANYYTRWDITIEEDIVASDRQQKGVASPYCLPGRFSHREPLVHTIDNGVLDQVLDAP